MILSARLQNFRFVAAVVGTVACLAGPANGSQPCQHAKGQLGVHRVIEIDTTSGPLFGDITKYARETALLEPGEVVLTFDDGPMPWITKSILDSLDTHCTRATFFSVGRMAIAYPESVKDILARGHTLGTHTWSHPLNLKTLSPEKARGEIERGFAAVAAAAGQPIAPFFRFPGLNDNAALLTHLQNRGVGTFTVDVVSNDSYIADANRLLRETLAKAESRRGGILLFHDIKSQTAKMLPALLTELQQRGFKVVHLVAKHPFRPEPAMSAEYTQYLVQRAAQGRRTPTTLFAAARAHAGVDDKTDATLGEPLGQVPGAGRQTLPQATLVTALAPTAKVFSEGGRPKPERVAVTQPTRRVTAEKREPSRAADPRAQVRALAASKEPGQRPRSATAQRPQPQQVSNTGFWPPANGGSWTWTTSVAPTR